MASPSRRIFCRAIATHAGPTEYCFYSASHTARCGRSARLRARPIAVMRCDVLLGAFLEDFSTRNLQQGVCARLAFSVQRIDVIEKHSFGAARLSACVRQAYQRIRAEPHVVGFTQPFITKNPAASVPLRNLQVGTIADSITAWLLESSNRPRCWIFLHSPSCVQR